jgi:hypothetical protein
VTPSPLLLLLLRVTQQPLLLLLLLLGVSQAPSAEGLPEHLLLF